MKEIIKEIAVKSEITKLEDNKLLSSIKDFFKKEKNIKFEIQESQGDVITLDIVLNFKPENKITARVEGRQEAYDIKRKLEEFLFKNFSISPLSIQGMNVNESNVAFEISFIWKNTDGKKATYNESVKTIKNNLGEEIKLDSNVMMKGKKARLLMFKDKEVICEVEGKRVRCSYSFLENNVRLISSQKKS